MRKMLGLEKTMKRITSILLLIITLFTLVGCKSKYPPVESTEEEAKTVYTLEYGGKRYEIKYELYRALFLSNRSTVDGGDRSVWEGENKDAYIAEINEIIKEKAAKIYSAFHLAKSLDIDPYSKEIDQKIQQYIELSVDGGGDSIGFRGDYDAYLMSLKDSGLNYAVQELMLRYSITLEKIDEYYKGKEDDALGLIDSKYSLSDEELRAYYFGDDCVRVLHAYMQDGVGGDTKAKMESIKAGIASSESDLDAALYIINNTLVTPTDLIINKKVSGLTIGRYALSEEYADYSASTFSLSPGETGEVVEVNDGTKGYYVIRALEKTEEHYLLCTDEVRQSFFDNLISKSLIDISKRLCESAVFEKDYLEIDHARISI